MNLQLPTFCYVADDSDTKESCHASESREAPASAGVDKDALRVLLSPRGRNRGLHNQEVAQTGKLLAVFGHQDPLESTDKSPFRCSYVKRRDTPYGEATLERARHT